MTCSAAAAQASDKDHMNKNLNKKTALFHTFDPKTHFSQAPCVSVS